MVLSEICLLSIEMSIVVVPGRHGGRAGQAGHPADPRAGGTVNNGAMARDQGGVLNRWTPHT